MKASKGNDWFAEGDAGATCERCGNEGAARIGERIICRECYAVYGSCCMEFGADDLWREREESPGPRA